MEAAAPPTPDAASTFSKRAAARPHRRHLALHASRSPAAVGSVVLLGAHRLEDPHRRAPRLLELRARLPHRPPVESGRAARPPEAYGALPLIFGTVRHVADRARDRDAARDRDRPLPQRARAEGRPRRREHARRAARRDPQRRARLLGDPRASAPFMANHLDAVAAVGARLPADLQRADPAGRDGPAHGRPDPLDHGAADHREHQPRAVPRRARRDRRRARSRSARRAGR